MEAKTVVGGLNGGWVGEWVGVMLHACTAHAGRVSADCACLGEDHNYGAGDSHDHDDDGGEGGERGGTSFAIDTYTEHSALQ